LVLGS